MEKSTYIYKWNEEKNEFLKKIRNISFEEIIVCIENGCIVDNVENPNENYKNQMIYMVELDNYIYEVPYVIDIENGWYFLKTIIPSRKYTKLYLQNKKRAENDYR